MKIYKLLAFIFLLTILLSSCAAPPTEEVGYIYFVKYESKAENWKALEYEYCRADSSGTNLLVYCWYEPNEYKHYNSYADYSAEIVEFKREKAR
jgi:hypothetical protein